MCTNHIPNCCPRTLSSCRQSGAFSVRCQQAARTYPVMTSRSSMCPNDGSLACPGVVLSSLNQCNVSGLLSHGRRHRCLSRGGIGGPRLLMAPLFVSSCCVHVMSCYVAAVSSDLFGGRELGTLQTAPQLTCAPRKTHIIEFGTTEMAHERSTYY